MPELKRNPDGTLDESVFEPDFELVDNWKDLFAHVVTAACRDYFYSKKAVEETKNRVMKAEEELKAFKAEMIPGNDAHEKQLKSLKTKLETAQTIQRRTETKIRSTAEFFRSESLSIFTDIPGEKMLTMLDQFVAEGRANLPGVSSNWGKYV